MSRPWPSSDTWRTSGLPFAIQEMVALLREHGTLIRGGRGWARKAIDELNVPRALRDSVLERVGRLPAEARAMVEAAAVLQVPVPVQVLVAICGLEREPALAGLEEALGSGLLSEHTALSRGAPEGSPRLPGALNSSARPADVGFRHMLALQAVYESIALPRRQVLHGRAAEAGRHGDDSEAARLLGDVLRDAPRRGTAGAHGGAVRLGLRPGSARAARLRPDGRTADPRSGSRRARRTALPVRPAPGTSGRRP
ncbi:hypothetical protein ACWEPN_24710 [Nonomuraea wenchangensis]